jgi:hypothetical protein
MDALIDELEGEFPDLSRRQLSNILNRYWDPANINKTMDLTVKYLTLLNSRISTDLTSDINITWEFAFNQLTIKFPIISQQIIQQVLSEYWNRIPKSDIINVVSRDPRLSGIFPNPVGMGIEPVTTENIAKNMKCPPNTRYNLKTDSCR